MEDTSKSRHGQVIRRTSRTWVAETRQPKTRRSTTTMGESRSLSRDFGCLGKAVEYHPRPRTPDTMYKFGQLLLPTSATIHKFSQTTEVKDNPHTMETATGAASGNQASWGNHPARQLHQLGRHAVENAPHNADVPEKSVRPLKSPGTPLVYFLPLSAALTFDGLVLTFCDTGGSSSSWAMERRRLRRLPTLVSPLCRIREQL